MNIGKLITVGCTVVASFCFLIGRTAYAQNDADAIGRAIFAANCAACHGSDGRGGERAPNITTRREIVSLSDAALISDVQHGVSGTAMPPFGYLGDEKVLAVVHYLRTLQGLGATAKSPGDPQLGEQLFYGKAGCATCHTMNGRGGFMGSDLSDYGAGRSLENVRKAVLDPNSSVDRKSQVVSVMAVDGKQFKGLVRAEDNYFLTLQSEDGVFHTFSRSSVAHVEYSGRSLMPDDYEKKLSSKEVDDLVSFLLKSQAQGKTSAEKHDANDDDNH